MAAVDELVRLSRLDPEWSWARAAIIARDWRRLAPVRAYAEALCIPVEMANESLPSIWRLREMQQFIDALRRDPARMLAVRDLVDVLNAIPSNRWTDLIAEGTAALAKELASKTIPVPDLVEWFAEWANDARGDQRALLLLTAHRSKGLEFDDVAILNGGWGRPSKGEDPDAPRRLFYVAMTRARRSLAIIGDGQDPYVQQGAEHVLRRAAPAVGADVALPTALYQMPNLKTVDLSWAGRLRPGHPSLAAISAAKVGDPIHVLRDGPFWTMEDQQGQVLGRMAKSWSPPQGLSFVRGEVGAIVRWRKSDNQEEFRARLQRDVWEAIVPELVFG
jgi:ATP-dependent DNA helicase RecQ